MLFLPPRLTPVDTVEPSSQGLSGTLSWKMAALLSCPNCLGDLDIAESHASRHGLEDGALICRSTRCSTTFAVRNGIPDLMPAHLLDNEAWREWEAHLDQFQKRRELRIEDATRLASRIHVKKKGLQRAFASFIGITSGVVLDVGCGPGKLRFHFDPSRVDYYGIDPTPLPDATMFGFARGLAEFIPFKSGTFTDVVVVSALDHFRDCTAFFKEVSRVLEPHGKLHVVQSVHDAASPLKLATHWLKDALEDRATRGINGPPAPHHMHEFTQSSFVDGVSSWFSILNQARYSRNWLSPDKLFMTLGKRP